MSDKNYEKYLEALKAYGGRGEMWRASYRLRVECEETLKKLHKFEDENLHQWNKAGDKLDKARSKFEEGME